VRSVKRALSPAEWRRLGGFAAAVIALHVLGFVTLIVVVAPHHFSLGKQGVFGIGIGITAYTLGLRHAVDADHIAAIDNTTRKLMADGKRPLGVGFFFSLGHSTVVFALALLVGIGVKAVAGQLTNESTTLHHLTSLVGTSVSGSFLYLIAIVNVVILIHIIKGFLAMRRGEYDEDELQRHLDSRGLMNRVLGRFTRSINHSWQMYPVGLLFGLGFETATEVTLLILASGAASSGLPLYAIMCLPVLFAAGMSLLDAIDGSFMNFAYGWAFSRPVRKLYYNITITGLSVAVALIIGTVELLSVWVHELSLKGAFWGAVANLDLNTVGFLIVGLFAATWAVALAVWRLARIETRWTSAVRTGPLGPMDAAEGGP
jgi:high-affinity nickel-transport protein